MLDELSPSARAQLARLVPAIGDPSSEPETERGEGQRLLFDGFLELIGKLGAERPALLWIEDIHWADRSTRSFLSYLATTSAARSVWSSCTYRADELHRRHPLRPLLGELERPGRSRRIELERFDREELDAQLADIIGADPDPDLAARLFARSEGNPLFTEELLAAGMDGRGALPPSLRDALLLRIERLSNPCQRLLQLLAAAGRADQDVLGAARSTRAGELPVALREAVDSQIVVIDDAALRASGTRCWRGRLRRPVAGRPRRPASRPGGRARVRRQGPDAAWSATAVAHHYNAAGDQPRALRSGDRGRRGGARPGTPTREAAGLLDRALELWPRVADAEAVTGLDHAELLSRAARIHYLAAEDNVAEALYRQAADVLGDEADPERLAAVLTAARRGAMGAWQG